MRAWECVCVWCAVCARSYRARPCKPASSSPFGNAELVEFDFFFRARLLEDAEASVSVPSQCAHPCHPSCLYARWGLEGM